VNEIMGIDSTEFRVYWTIIHVPIKIVVHDPVLIFL
jgi:hypothetical protein